MKRPELSIVIPLYREKETLGELARRLIGVIDSMDLDGVEVVLVDDGSDDAQWQVIEKITADDSRFRGLRLARNFGLQAAATAALAESKGRAVVLMDGDLQDPPELIPTLVARWRLGAEVVQTRKSSRQEGLLKRLAFKGFYFVFGLLTDVRLETEAGLFSLMDRRVVDAILSLGERVRYVPGLRAWTGFDSVVVTYDRSKRYAGKPQRLSRLIGMAVDAILAFSTVPLRAAMCLGLVLVVLSFFGLATIIGLRVTRPDMIPGWASDLTVTIFIGAMLLTFLGVVAEYVGRIYEEVKQRPIYLVSRRVSSSEQREEQAHAGVAHEAVSSEPQP